MCLRQFVWASELVAGSVSPAFEGSERWRRAGTPREHRKDLIDLRGVSRGEVRLVIW